MKIILASASPRRRELLTQIGLEFQVVVSNVEETVTETAPAAIVEELSAQKAEGVLLMLGTQKTGDRKAQVDQQDEKGDQAFEESDCLIIGSDTIVAVDGQILGKPKDPEDAKRMLRMLQGRAHEVYTGVTVLKVRWDGTEQNKSAVGEGVSGVLVERRTFHEETKVIFFPMTDEEIETYVASLDPLDKAGAYGIQGFCARYIQGIEGDYNNVVGLPVGRLYQEIKDWIS